MSVTAVKCQTMGRWEPNARARLTEAALALYQQRGFDETAVADIAARAGLTERTFFRHFADKREVLFGGASELEELLVAAVAAAPASARPLDAVAAALEATSPFFDQRRPFAKARHAVVSAHPALQERELIKLSSLAAAVAGALRRRGVGEAAATLAGESGMAVFKVAFARWLADGKKRDLAHHVREALAQLREVTGAPARGASRARPGRSRTRTAKHRARTAAG